MKEEPQTEAENARLQYEMMRKAFNEVIRLAKVGIRHEVVVEEKGSSAEEKEMVAKRGLEAITFVSTFLKSLDENIDLEIEEQLK